MNDRGAISECDEQFGQVLIRRYEENQPACTSKSAIGFGRYLRAARKNKRLTYAQLSKQTKISEQYIIALESGLVPVSQIKHSWLKQLATQLEENYHSFLLLLSLTPESTYFGTGWQNSRDKYRAIRGFREPEWQFFSK